MESLVTLKVTQKGYKQVNQQKDYPLRCRYALCFPEST